MKYATVCSGIEACSVAWEPLGWEPVFFSEIDRFPSAVLAHHYPNTPNLGDMTKIDGTKYTGSVDLICGGTPCQSFSVAGLRGGLADERGNLALTFCRLVDQIRPTWVVWENVPGVLSSNKGRDFGSILGALGELGYGFAYRVLDAQYFGVPQRRRRVFLVGHIGGGWAAPAAVLFERQGGGGHPSPRRSEGQKIAAYFPSSFGGYSEGLGTLRKSGGDHGHGSEILISEPWPPQTAPTLDRSFARLQGQDNQHINGGAGLFVPVAFQPQATASFGIRLSDVCQTLDKSKVPGVFQQNQRNEVRQMPVAGALKKSQGSKGVNWIADHATVRRITPLEAGRLQGFPDYYTAIYGDKTPDKPQHEAYGNSMAVPVMRWIGERIEQVDKILKSTII